MKIAERIEQRIAKRRITWGKKAERRIADRIE